MAFQTIVTYNFVRQYVPQSVVNNSILVKKEDFPRKVPLDNYRFGVRRRRPRRPRRGVTARRTEPGNRAHAFRMTLVVQGNKLPQINGGSR